MHRTYDPTKVKHRQQRERQRHIGHKDIGDRDRPIYVSEYGSYMEEDIQLAQTSDQIAEWARDVSKQEVGERIAIRDGMVTKEKVPELPRIYPWRALLEMKVHEWIEELMEGPEYRVPTLSIPRAARKKLGKKGRKKRGGS